MSHARKWIIAVLAAGLALLLQPAAAGSLSVNPIRVTLGQSVPTAALTLENTGSTPMVLQLQLMRWSAEQGEERYEASEDLVATPPIMTIRPGQSQVVRVGLGGAVDEKRQLAYRLFVEEVPPPPAAGYQGLQVALRLGIPVFVEPLQSAEPVLQWRAIRGDDASLVLRVRNDGNAHLRLLRLRLQEEGKTPLAEQTVAQYLLPGQQRNIALRLGQAVTARRVAVSAETDRGPLDAALDVENP